MNSNELIVPSIELPEDWKSEMKEYTGPTIKFNLRDHPNHSNLDTHEKRFTLFKGEYGDDNAEFWCQFEASLQNVFKRKPCTQASEKFGVLEACLTGKALNDYYSIKSVLQNENDATFKEVLNDLRWENFESETPRYDQIEYIKSLRKPSEATWKQFVSYVDKMIAALDYFPEDTDEVGNVLDPQPTLSEDEYKKFLLKAAPRPWYENLTANGQDPKMLNIIEIKRRFRRMERVERQQKKRQKRRENERGKMSKRTKNTNVRSDKKHNLHCYFCKHAGHSDDYCNHAAHPKNLIEWDDAVAPIRYADDKSQSSHEELFLNMNDEEDQSASIAVKETARRTTKILDAKYEKANLEEIVTKIKSINDFQKRKLLKLLKKFEGLFDGTLGTFNCEPADIKLKPRHDEPFHMKHAFDVPQIHRRTLKKEIDRLCKLGVLKKTDAGKHAYPTFIIPKKNGTVRFVTDFRKLNAKILREPFPPPTIADILQNLEGFMFATSLDLNMGYYTIKLTPTAQELCTIITPWGKYSYQRLPMGVMVSSDIFQMKMMQLMQGLEDFVRCYLDDLLLINKSSFEDHLIQIEQVLKRLNNAGLKVNAEKSVFFATEIEYLGFWLTREGIKPMPEKVQAIRNLERPKTQKQL